MNEKEKQEYLEKYKKEKEKGIPFFPDILFKDAVVAIGLFLVLIGLAYFIGAPLEERANPADTLYTPRPEWYFLFLFQLLKYFPGELEFVGVVVIPTIAILLLFALPLLDKSPKRHFLHRKVINGVTALSLVAIGLLTYLSIHEAPPPAEAAEGDQTAALYTDNCAPCHGATISVPTGTNLRAVIAEGKHEGMPAWSADLTTDEIDSLTGFILSPGGSLLFTGYCGSCHEAPELVTGNPIELKNAFEQGQAYPPHTDQDVPNWTAVISLEDRTTLLNFLVAPDGQRLFAINCSPCHGTSVGFRGTEEDIRTLISQGGLHLEMPPWRETLSAYELDTLAQYVVDPSSTLEGDDLFQTNCSSCHGDRIPESEYVDEAREIIAEGGSHETMPVWGNLLTDEQLDALANFTLEAARGSPVEVGRELFKQNCASCHGDFGEGGPNPARQDDVIAPISTAEYLKTRDDHTLQAVIAQGQPNFGMSPFGSAFGGPMDDDDIDAIVVFLRSWEENPPVDNPPEIDTTIVSLDGHEIFTALCSQCHGPEGLGSVGPSLRSQTFRNTNTAEDIFNTISNGHEATPMISWGELLGPDQIQELIDFVFSFEIVSADVLEEPAPEPTPGIASLSEDVMPIFEAKCVPCHGTMGGWDASNYEDIVNSGNNGPAVIPGDVANSLLAQKILGTHTEGTIMPPGGKMTNPEIQVILDWIKAEALDN